MKNMLLQTCRSGLYLLDRLCHIILLTVGVTVSFTAGAGAVNEISDEYHIKHQQITSQSVRNVDVIMRVDEISDIDLSAGHYQINAEILLRWSSDGSVSEPIKQGGDQIIYGSHLDKYLEGIWYPEIMLVNQVEPRETQYRTLSILPDGSYELFEKFDANLSFVAGMRAYPFGTLKLKMTVVAFTHTINELLLRPDSYEIGHEGAKATDIFKGNWSLSHIHAEAHIDHSLNRGGTEAFSATTFAFHMKHNYVDALQKIFFPIFLIILISLGLNHYCSLRYTANTDVRINGQVTLMLTILALKFSLGDELPRTHYLNLTDALFVAATLMTALGSLSAVYINHLYRESLDTRAILASAIEARLRFFLPLIAVFFMCVIGLVYGVFS
jgi:hypothetical protein